MGSASEKAGIRKTASDRTEACQRGVCDQPLVMPETVCAREEAGGSMPATHHFAGLEPVHRATVRAAALAVVGHIDEDARMVVPQLHVRLGAGAVHTAIAVEVLGAQFDDGGSHVLTPW